MSKAVLRAKFSVTKISHFKDSREVFLAPVYGADGTANGEWSKYTPSGDLRMLINNEKAFDALEVGKEYFLDFTPAETE